MIPKKTNASFTAPSDLTPDETVGGERIIQVSLDKIVVNPHQPRTDFEHQALEELINSIREHGILQPLIVTKKDDGYELVAGERRFRSAKFLELPAVPVIVRDITEVQKLEFALVENIQRQNLNSIEEAMAYRRLIDEFSLTQEQAAQKVGKSRAVVANTLRLLDLPEEVQQAIANGQISEGHAKVLAGLESEAEKIKFFKKIIDDKLTVRDTEMTIKKIREPKGVINSDPNLVAQEEELQSALGTKVKIEKRGDGGKIVIEFYSPEELREIINKIDK